MMIKSLKILAKQINPTHIEVTLTQRLPDYIQSPCHITCDIQVTKKQDYYQLTLIVCGQITVTCQRCLGHFVEAYSNRSELALCPDDVIAERLMSIMECTVNPGDDIDLEAIITDELHLFCPEKHRDINDCDELTCQYLTRTTH